MSGPFTASAPILLADLIRELNTLPADTRLIRIDRDDNPLCIGIGLDSTMYECTPTVTLVLRLPTYHRTSTY